MYNTYVPVPGLDEWAKAHKVSTAALRSESVRKGAALIRQQCARRERALDKALARSASAAGRLYWNARQAA